MIPKVLHYCWFGHNPLPEIVQECMESWKKFCPDYTFQCWNEDNFDFSGCEYAIEAYRSKKWAFVSDYVRLKVLYEYGGIYIDTDVELIKPIDDLLSNEAFMGFEHGFVVNTGLIVGAEKGQHFLKELIDLYESMHFILPDGSLNLTSCVDYTTDKLTEKGLKRKNVCQVIDGIKIYPTEYFCPKNQYTERISITSNTYSIHRYIGTWADETTKYGQELKNRLLRDHGEIIGKILYFFKYSFYVLKKDGVLSLLKKIKRKVLVFIRFGLKD